MLIHTLSREDVQKLHRAMSLDALAGDNDSAYLLPRRPNFFEACHRIIGREDVAVHPQIFMNEFGAWLEYDIAPKKVTP